MPLGLQSSDANSDFWLGRQQRSADIEAGPIDTVLVYKVDRLSRSLLDFARMRNRRRRDRQTGPQPLRGTERLAMGCVSVLFGLLASWIAWIAANFLDGDGWFDFVVGLVLHEVIVSVGLLALAVLIGAVFAPAWMGRVFEAASEHAARAAAIFFLVLIAPALLLTIGWSALAALGIVQ